MSDSGTLQRRGDGRGGDRTPDALRRLARECSGFLRRWAARCVQPVCNQRARWECWRRRHDWKVCASSFEFSDVSGGDGARQLPGWIER